MRAESRIIIERGSVALDGAGERIITWQRLAGPLAASRRSLFGKEVHGDVTVALEQVAFEIQWAPTLRNVGPRERLLELTAGDQIKSYDIVAVYELGRRRQLRIIGSGLAGVIV